MPLPSLRGSSGGGAAAPGCAGLVRGPARPLGRCTCSCACAACSLCRTRVSANLWGWEESCDLRLGHVTAGSLLAAWSLRQEPGRWETDAEQRGEKLGGLKIL